MIHNLSIIDNIPLYNVEALVARYIYSLNVKIVAFDLGYKIYNRVMYKSTIPPNLPRTRQISYVRNLKYPPNWYEFYRVCRNNDNAIELAKKINQPLYLTFDNGLVLSTMKNKWQISGTFAEVVSKTCLLMYLDDSGVDLNKVNDLGSFFTVIDEKDII